LADADVSGVNAVAFHGGYSGQF